MTAYRPFDVKRMSSPFLALARSQFHVLGRRLRGGPAIQLGYLSILVKNCRRTAAKVTIKWQK